MNHIGALHTTVEITTNFDALPASTFPAKKRVSTPHYHCTSMLQQPSRAIVAGFRAPLSAMRTPRFPNIKLLVNNKEEKTAAPVGGMYQLFALEREDYIGGGAPQHALRDEKIRRSSAASLSLSPSPFVFSLTKSRRLSNQKPPISNQKPSIEQSKAVD